MIKIFIVDDHYLFAQGLKAMFRPGDGIEVVASTTNGKEAPSILEKEDIDIILMDISMPILDGIETMQLIFESGFHLPVLMLTMHQDIRQIKRALENGAQGYILKDASKEELIEAIETVYRRQNYFHPKVNNQVFDHLRGKRSQNKDDLASQLSDREKEIIASLAQGMNGNQVAQNLFISPKNAQKKYHA